MSRLRTAITAGLAAIAVILGLVTVAVSSPSHSAGETRRVAISLQAQQLEHPVALMVRIKYLVRQGDTLSAIAKHTCGRANRWPDLWWANRHEVKNPNTLRIGEKLTLPPCGVVSSHIWARAMKAGTPAVVVVSAAKPAPISAAPAAPAAAPAGGNVSTAGMGAFQACVIQAESGGNPTAVNPSSGAGGLYQFLLSTWDALGFGAAYPGGAQTAPVSVQNAAFYKEYAESGTSAWSAYDGC